MFHFNIWMNEDTLDIWNMVSSFSRATRGACACQTSKCHAALYCWSFCLWNACGIPGRPSRTWSLHIEDDSFIALAPHKRPSCCGVYCVSLPWVPAVLTRHLYVLHLPVEASPLLFALPGAPRCGRNRGMLKALCPPSQPQTASAPRTAIKQRLLGTSNPSTLLLVFSKVPVRLKLQRFIQFS